MTASIDLKSPDGTNKATIQHTSNSTVVINTDKIVQTDVENVFSTEQVFKGTGTYEDPDYGVVRAIKVGNLGIATSGDIKAKTVSIENPNAPNTGSGLSIGNLATIDTPYIDFNSSGYSNDFDVRLIVSGGTNAVDGAGNLTIIADAIYHNGSELMDYGTNANGSYIRFSDGTQICAAKKSANLQSPTAHAWPASFSGTLLCVATNDTTSAAYCSTVNLTPTTFQFWSSTTNHTVTIFGFGRWY